MKLKSNPSAIVLAVFIMTGSGLAQDGDTTEVDPYKWKKTMVADLSVAQAAYSDSWTGGEVGSFSWVGNINGNAEKLLSELLKYRGQLKLSFGQTVTQDADTEKWSKPQKTSDLIDWENVGLFLIGSHVDPYVAFRLESQFYDASHDAKNLYLNPLTLTESAGISHRLYENDKDHVTSRLGGAIKQTITRFVVDEVTLETESTTENAVGIESVTDVILSFRDNLQWTSKLSLFQGLYNAIDGEEPATDDWKTVDVNWENYLTAQVTRIIAVTFYTQILYDKQVIDKARFKETIGLGLKFNII